MAMIDDLKQALRSKFPGAKVALSRVARGERVGGSIIWDGFDGQAQIDRQTRLREAISSLPPEQQRQVTFILTLTPHEKDALVSRDSA